MLQGSKGGFYFTFGQRNVNSEKYWSTLDEFLPKDLFLRGRVLQQGLFTTRQFTESQYSNKQWSGNYYIA